MIMRFAVPAPIVQFLLAQTVFWLGLDHSVGAADWPQWRGVDGTGVAHDANLPIRWSATDGVHWKADLPGRGLSSPIIAGDRLYLTACTGVNQDRLHVLCFDA